MNDTQTKGPLDGLRVIELEALGPVPYAGMFLADLGAEVIAIHRPNADLRGKYLSGRNKKVIELDIKNPDDLAKLHRLLTNADVMLEGFRPGVLERLGLAPDELLASNSGLIIGRMTGWGQSGPLATTAGHDINYIALTGALAAIGPTGGAPVPPLNLVGDFAGGSLFLIIGVLAALQERHQSGKGQVIDAAMVDGVSHLMTMFWSLRAEGMWNNQRGSNMLDGGAPYYGCYRCSCDNYLSIGPIEPKFWAEFVEKAEIDPELAQSRDDPATWADLKAEIGARLKTKSRDEWMIVFADSDACVAPVLTMNEVTENPHMAERGVILDEFGALQPAPAPRFSRSQAVAPVKVKNLDIDDLLSHWSC